MQKGLRPIWYQEWVDGKKLNPPEQRGKYVWQKDPGDFHQWSQAAEDNEIYPGAIIERHDGSVLFVSVNRVSFSEPVICLK